MTEQPNTYHAPEDQYSARWWWDSRFLTVEEQERMGYEDLRPDPGTPYGHMGEMEIDQETWEDGQKPGCGRTLGDLFLAMVLICAIVLLIFLILFAVAGGSH